MEPDNADLLRQYHGRVSVLIHQYFAALDSNDLNRVIDCFARDGRFSLRGGSEILNGREEIDQYFRESRGPAKYPFKIHNRTHAVGNIAVTQIHDVGVISVSTRAIVCLSGVWDDGRAALSMRGIVYEDVCELGDGVWRFSNRKHRSTWEHTFPATNPPVL